MNGLIVNVLYNTTKLVFTARKCAVTRLPIKVPSGEPFVVDPLSGKGFNILYKISYRDARMHAYKQMAVIGIAINRNCFRVEPLNNSAHEGFYNRPVSFLNQALATCYDKHKMNMNLGV